METRLPQRKQIRLQNYDYTRPAYYYITIVVNGKLNLFGKIDNGTMHLSLAGETIKNSIEEIPSRFEKTEITEYIVMPNHIHLVFYNGGEHYVPDIVRWFKSVTTNRYIHGVNEMGWYRFDKTLWQRNYYEHIIRNQQSYSNILNYIRTNPERWRAEKEDEDIEGLPNHLTGVHGGTPLPKTKKSGVHGGTPLPKTQ